jgi:hypothetical protein
MSEDTRTFDSVIVYKAKDQSVPEAFFKKLSDEGFTSCVGLAASINNKVFMEVKPDAMEPEDLAAMTEEHKALEMVLHFGEYPDDFDKDDDVQPHVVLRNDDAEPIVVAFLRGDFSEWEDDEDANKRSNEYFAAQTQLVPMMNKLFTRAEESMDTFVEDLLTNPKTHRAIRSLYGDEGTVVLLTSNNKILLLSGEKDEDQNNFDWGWVTNNFEYKEIDTRTHEPEPEQKTFFKKKKVIAKAPAETPVAEDKPQNQEELKKEFADKIAEAKSTTALPALVMTKRIAVPGNMSQQKRKHWIKNKQREHGMPAPKDLPSDWKHCKFITVPLNPMVLKDLKDIPKDVITSTLRDSEPGLLPKSTVENLVNKFLPTVKEKMIDINNKEVFNPPHLQSLEREYPSFIEAIGLKDVRETLNWGPQDIMKMGDLKAIAAYVFDLQSFIIEQMKKAGDTSKVAQEQQAPKPRKTMLKSA